MPRLHRWIAAAALAALAAGAHAAVDAEFFRAINVDNAGEVKDYLAKGLDPNATNERGQCALFLAVRDESAKVVATLLAHPKIEIDKPNASSETPVMMAALRGQLEWTKALLDRGAALNREGWTPLHYAATGPGMPVVAMLLDRGAQIEAPSPNGTTPLMMAARYGAEESVLLLLARGASLTAKNMQGLNAADFARLGGREKLAARLAPPKP